MPEKNTYVQPLPLREKYVKFQKRLSRINITLDHVFKNLTSEIQSSKERNIKGRHHWGALSTPLPQLAPHNLQNQGHILSSRIIYVIGDIIREQSLAN